MQCIGARSIESHYLAFTVHKYANSPPSISPLLLLLSSSPSLLPLSLPSLLSPHHIYNTVKYLPSCICLRMELRFNPLSLSAFVFFHRKFRCTKTGRPAGEGLTSPIPPSVFFFSNLVLFSLPTTSCQDARSTSGLPLEKHGQSGNAANSSLQNSKVR